MKVLVITGTPGTGKTTISEKAAGMIAGSTLIHVNAEIKKHRLYTSRSRGDGALIVDMDKLKVHVSKLVSKARGKVLILEGHILCDMRMRNATAVVIREHLPVLLKRMKKRGYNRKKTADNLISEATDYCGIRALANYGKVYELMCKGDTARKIAMIADGEELRSASTQIELLQELVPLLKKGAI